MGKNIESVSALEALEFLKSRKYQIFIGNCKRSGSFAVVA